jgi:glycosyltransferase involved in cell wall biosynthesis
MMSKLGHNIKLYASEDNDAHCQEHVTCITKQEIKNLCGVTSQENVLLGAANSNGPHWKLFNKRVIEELKAVIQPHDIICITQGVAHNDIVDAFPDHLKVEIIVGYSGQCDDRTWKVYPCHGWRHILIGSKLGAHGCQGRFFDRVIPHFLDPGEFHLSSKEPYLLFVGRLNTDKGISIAIDTANTLGVRLKVAGKGDYKLPSWVEYEGLIGVEKRAELMSKAMGVFATSLYVEPFNLVAVEAQFSGTPAITTDWGGFVDTVESKWRCNNLQEFVDAAKLAMAGEYVPFQLREKAIEKYSMDAIGPKYEKYFEQLLTLFDKGFYQLEK